MRRPITGLALLLGVALLLGGEGGVGTSDALAQVKKPVKPTPPDKPPKPKACREDDDCAKGLACLKGRCRKPRTSAPEAPRRCRKDADCRSGEVCRAQVCAANGGGKACPAGMVAIPAGSFTMGLTTAEIARLQPECQRVKPDCTWAYFEDAPAHLVSLREFFIDKLEVTNEAFVEFLNAGGDPSVRCGGQTCMAVAPEKPGSPISLVGGRYVVAAGFEHHPVVNVSWYGADGYCRWKGHRLPTEAEWEKAARGGDARLWPWGTTPPTCADALYANDAGGVAAQCVGSTLPGIAPDGMATVGQYTRDLSPYGVFDLAGNVQEWVADWYDKDIYKTGPSQDPTGPAFSDTRVRRGASWGHIATQTLASFRDMAKPETIGDLIGFRCAASR